MVPPPRGITLDWPPRFSAPAVHEITHALLGGREGDRHGKEFRVKLREIGGGLIQVTFYCRSPARFTFRARVNTF